MGDTTTNLGLFKYDTIADAKEEFNIDTALNDNWDKIDDAFNNIQSTVNEAMESVDIDEIATDLNGKADKDLNNISPSQSAKEEIISWSLPDYSAGINLSGNSFTAPVDGFATIQPYRGPNCAIYVNGYFVGLGSCENAAATIQVYLAKDDVLTTDSGFSFAQGTSIFYPLKGVN